MQKVFWIDMCNDPKIVGKEYIQIGLDQESTNRLYGKKHIPLTKIDFIPEFELGKKAKKTDIIYKGVGREKGLIFNSKVKRIFDTYVISPHHYNDIVIIDTKSNLREEYNWLIFDNQPEVGYINFELSTFNFMENYKVLQQISFLNGDEFLKFKNTNCNWKYSLKGHKIHLNHRELPDLFTLPIDSHVYMVESIAREIKTNNITGLEIRDNESIEHS